MTRTSHHIIARDLGGTPGPYLIVKPNESDGGRTVYLSAPKFCLLDEATVYELADTLVDLIES